MFSLNSPHNRIERRKKTTNRISIWTSISFHCIASSLVANTSNNPVSVLSVRLYRTAAFQDFLLRRRFSWSVTGRRIISHRPNSILLWIPFGNCLKNYVCILSKIRRQFFIGDSEFINSQNLNWFSLSIRSTTKVMDTNSKKNGKMLSQIINLFTFANRCRQLGETHIHVRAIEKWYTNGGIDCQRVEWNGKWFRMKVAFKVKIRCSIRVVFEFC